MSDLCQVTYRPQGVGAGDQTVNFACRPALDFGAPSFGYGVDQSLNAGAGADGDDTRVYASADVDLGDSERAHARRGIEIAIAVPTNGCASMAPAKFEGKFLLVQRGVLHTRTHVRTLEHTYMHAHWHEHA